MDDEERKKREVCRYKRDYILNLRKIQEETNNKRGVERDRDR